MYQNLTLQPDLFFTMKWCRDQVLMSCFTGAYASASEIQEWWQGGRSNSSLEETVHICYGMEIFWDNFKRSSCSAPRYLQSGEHHCMVCACCVFVLFQTFLAAFEPLLSGCKTGQHGTFADSCINHCQAAVNAFWNGYVVGGQSPRETFTDWYMKLPHGNSCAVDCAYPCNHHCLPPPRAVEEPWNTP